MMSIQTSRRNFFRRYLFTMISGCLFSLAILLLPLLLMEFISIDELEDVKRSYDAVSIYLLAFRVFLVASVIAAWPVLIRLFASYFNWDEVRLIYILSLRWRIALWAVLLELMVGQNILNKAFA